MTVIDRLTPGPAPVVRGADPQPRVLHVTQVTEPGGLVNVLLELTRGQSLLSWDVHIAAPPFYGPLGDAFRLSGVTLHEWPAERAPNRGVVQEVQRLQSILATVKPDVVHLHSSKAGLSGRLAVRGRYPTIFQPHAWSFHAVRGPVRAAAHAWESLGQRWVSVNLCVSEAELHEGRRGIAMPRPFSVVPNGVEIDSWMPIDRAEARAALGLPAHAPVGVIVGRLVRQKGQDMAVTAWPKVRRRCPDAELYLIGEGPDRDKLRALAGLGVHLVGHADPRMWYAASNVVIMPSRWEGMALVPLEAMASGRPVVATDVAGARETVGSLQPVVPIDNADALAERVLSFLLNPTVADAIGEVNHQRVAEDFSTRRSVDEVCRITLELVASRRRNAMAA